MQNFILSKSTFHWFQWISMNFNEFSWMIFDPKSPKLIQSGFGSPSHVQFTKYSPTKCTSKTVQIFLNCGQIRIMRLMNDFEAIWIRSVFGPFVVRFGGRVICIINDILSNKTTKCLIQTISVMFNRIYSLKFQKNPKF